MTGTGINPQFNNFNWQNVPYQMPATLNYNTNFNLFNNSNFNVPVFDYNNGNNYMSLFSTPTSSSSKKEKTLSFEERRKKIKENADKIKAYNEAIAENKAQIAEINAMKDADGNVAKPKEGEKIETLADRKNMPWYQRTWKAVKAMGKGVLKMGVDFLGFENGKFNVKKCLKNVGIAGLAIGACFIPYVGPVISTALLATGVVMGTVKTGIGISKAVKAETAVERDRAFEDVGAGAFTAISSAFGLKAKGASFRLGQTSSSAPAASTTTPSVAKTGFGQFFKDMAINSIKATKHSMVTDAAAIRSAGGGFKGYKNVVVDRTKAAWAECKPKTSFENAVKSQKSEISAKIADIDNKLADVTLSAQEKALLTAQKQSYQNYINQLDGLKTKSDWTKFGRDPISKAQEKRLIELREQFIKDGSVEINGQTFSSSDKAMFDQYISQMIKEESNLSGSANKLFTMKEDAVSRMGIRNKRFKTEIDEYLGGEKNWFRTQWELNKMNTEGLTTGQKIWHGTKATVSVPFKLMSIPFKPYMMYEQSGCKATPYKIDQMFNPYYETYGEVISATELVKALTEQQKQLKDEVSKIYKN